MEICGIYGIYADPSSPIGRCLARKAKELTDSSRPRSSVLACFFFLLFFAVPSTYIHTYIVCVE